MKGSVRSLPQHKMRDIRRMFEESCDDSDASANQVSIYPPSDMESGSDYHVKDTLSKFEEKDEMGDEEPAQRWRRHISPPAHVERSNLSPTRKPRTNVSPSRNPKISVSPSRQMESGSSIPTPTPRRTVAHNTNNGGQHPEQGLAGLSVQQFGNIAGAFAMTDCQSEPSRVSKLVGKMEASSPYQTAEASKTPGIWKGSGAGLSSSADIEGSPEHRKLSDAGNTSEKKDKSNLNPVYAKLWDTKLKSTDSGNVSKGKEEKRPVSVFERLKMFENIDTPSSSVTPSSTKPLKPPPPTRQKSWTEEHTTEKINNTKDTPGTKVPPKRPCPPMRQRSLTEKNSFEGEETEQSDSNLNKLSKSSNKQPPPMPPMKPPRTGAHDDYVKVKLDKQTQNKVLLDSIENCEEKTEDDENRTLNKKKPLRPPPPSKKTRPFSVCTDTGLDVVSSDGSESDEMSTTGSGSNNDTNNDTPFYEMISFAEPGSKTSQYPIKHWDLPRISHPEPIKRSLSDDCIHKSDKAIDNEGNVVYMDPDLLRISHDIYVDIEGYAVPSKLVKRNKSDVIDDTEPSKPIGDRVKSKIRRIKNFFAEPEKPSQPAPERIRPDKSSQKRKTDAIKQKVDLAFEHLKGSWRRNNSESQESSEEEDDNTATDTDSRVDEKEIRKRVQYSQSVRFKTSQSIKESRKYHEKVYPQLFEYAMIVGLELKQDTSMYEPYVKYKFPEIRNYKLTMEGKLFPCSEGKDSNVSVPLFCFPDAANYKPSSTKSKSQSYNFVLTDFDGGRVYGYCRRLVPPKCNKKPEVICVMSPVDAFSMYNKLLEEIEKKRLQSMDSAQEMIAAAFGRPLPSPGQTETIRTLDEAGDMETIFLSRETDNRVENVNCECLLSLLGPDKLLKVFASILLERSVLFCAKQLSTLSSTIHAITSLLYPFSWQHTFIPVLPAAMIEVVCSPSPYIIGITSSLIAKVLTLPLDEHVMIVDVDKRSFITSQGDEGTLLPKLLGKSLKTALNMCRIDPDAKLFPNLMISESFLRFFVETVGHYGQYIHTQSGGQKNFQTEEFVKGVNSTSLRQLLEWFVETQMFEVFVTTQIEKRDWSNTIEYFQSRIQEHKFTSSKDFKRRPAKRAQ